MTKKYILHISKITLLLFLVLVIQAEGATVKDYFKDTLTFRGSFSLGGGFGASTDGRYGGNQFTATVQKTFNFIRPNGSNAPSSFKLIEGEKITAKEGKTTGSWFFKGKSFDTPPMNTKTYSYKVGSRGQTHNVTVLPPRDSSGLLEIRSSNSNVISCNSNGCTAKKPGTAKVTVIFGNKVTVLNPSANYKFRTEDNQNSIVGVGYGNFTKYWRPCLRGKTNCIGDRNNSGPDHIISLYPYVFAPITYTVTVEADNSPHVVKFTGATNITTSSAKLNWTYSDPDNDKQKNYQVQISKNNNFNNVMRNIARVGQNVRNVSPAGLDQNTTYYVRVRAYNSENLWSPWSTGSFKTIVDKCSNINGNQATVPNGYSQNSNGTCSQTAVDKCSNVPGNQTNISFPWKQNSNGTCSVDRCSNIGGNQSSVPSGYSQNSNGTCSTNRAVNGSCTNTLNQCNRGTFRNTADTTSAYKWQCAGSNGGTTASCSANKPSTPPPSCENGAANYPSCTSCPAGERMSGGQCGPSLCVGSGCGSGTGGNGSGGSGTGGNGSGTGNQAAATGTASFNPSFATGSDQTCPLYIDVTDTLGCTIVNRVNTSSTIPANTNNIVDSQGVLKYGVGTYTVSCTGTDNAVQQIGVIACYGNPDIKED